MFENYLFRCSSLGHILTNLPEKITAEQLQELKDLQNEKITGKNANGNKTKWTDTKQDKVNKLLKIQSGEDTLPPGCITHLDNIFRSVFWGRKRILYAKYLDKGNICEEDGLELLSKLDGKLYLKNEKQFQNAYIQGCPDNITGKVKDNKAKWDMDSFDNSTLESLWEWQVRGYLWLTILEDSLETHTEGEICCTLVNNPINQIVKERRKILHQTDLDYEEANVVYEKIEEITTWLSGIDLDRASEEFISQWREKCQDYQSYIEVVIQAEANMIFDYDKFKKQLKTESYGKYQDFKILTPNPENLTLPAHMRVKRFPVTLEPEHIEHIIRRVKMCREYLVEKELETLKKMQSA